jgi:hypothetical protein
MYSFPFDDGSVMAELVGREMVFCRHLLSNSKFEPLGTIVLGPDHSVSGAVAGRWSVSDGAIQVSSGSGSGAVVEFNGLETTGGGEVYLDGEMFLESSQKGFVRAVLYPTRKLGDGYVVAISSHVDYADVTLPRILRTIRRSGCAAKTLAVICGADGSREEESDGCERWYVPWNAMGFAGLAVASRVGSPYILLLHDTCDVQESFPKVMEGIDVGLPYDAVLAADDLEIGIWRTGFVVGTGIDVWATPPGRLMSRFKGSFRMWKSFQETPRDGGMKDIYGGGNARRVFYYDSFGIRKYRTDKASGAKP